MNYNDRRCAMHYSGLFEPQGIYSKYKARICFAETRFNFEPEFDTLFICFSNWF